MDTKIVRGKLEYVKPTLKCKLCKVGHYEFSRYCGAYVCNHCDDHKNLARCYCGWSKTGSDGRKELEEMGEQIDADY